MHVNPMVLTERNLDDISDKIRDTTTKVLQQFKQKYMKTLVGIHKDLHELQIQRNRISRKCQEGEWHASHTVKECNIRDLLAVGR